MNAQTTTAQPATRQLVTAPPAEATAAQTGADGMLSQVKALSIDCPEVYEAAGEMLLDIRARYAAVEKQRVFLKEPYLEGGRRIDAFFKVPLERLAEAGTMVKDRMLAFKQAEDRKAEKLRQEQAERDRVERERLQAIADAAAQAQRDADAQAERLRQDAAATAAELADAGDDEAAAQVVADAELAAAEVTVEAQLQAEDAQVEIDLAAVAPAPLAVQSAARASGVSSRKTWKFQSIDRLQLVLGIATAHAAGDQDKVDQLLAYIQVDESALNRVAGALKGAARVPGVTFHEVESLAASGRRKP